MLLAAVFGAANASADEGSEEKPHVADAAGNVHYSTFYAGSRDHDYLDVIAVWLQFNKRNDTIRVTFKVADTRLLEKPSPDWSVQCQLRSDFMQWGDRVGSALAQLRYFPFEGRLVSNVTLQMSNPQRFVAVEHSFVITYRAMGAFSFEFARQPLLFLGDEFRNFDAACIEIFSPFGMPTPIFNDNYVQSRANYTFGDLKPLPAPNAGSEPGKAKKIRGTDAAGPEGVAATPAVIALAVLALLALRRRD